MTQSLSGTLDKSTEYKTKQEIKSYRKHPGRWDGKNPSVKNLFDDGQV